MKHTKPVNWRNAMNRDIKRFFNIDAEAEVVDIDIKQEERGSGGCATCRWTVFVVEVGFRTKTGTRYETFEGSLTDFLSAVSDAARETVPT